MSWQALSTRVASFTAPPKPAGARPTRGHQKTSWPHPPSFRANPATLAEAGFYYAPSSSDLDNVVCFMCAKELSDWEAEDDPFQIHAVKCPKCPWVVVRCALAQDLDDEGNYNFPTPDRLPNSRVLERARLATYTKGKEKIWPHDGTKNHGAMSKKMAKAGFVYTPSSTPDDDTATCLYCNTSLSGWDAEDDPLSVPPSPPIP
ncbi:inhibitor of apoptosis repeat-containing protein [Sistotremastrum suecicum HHB10207 ss-3]|uniref:Inhibitor of apoptosis repeat-containing protein n=1 Tax=Sistotremastrum suecicum HHB10207 ss-3 TaxID=1314776 RepID=A0A165ZZ36_9AGAM|nr:inhibitor of apoptosis repeat-containing protein [Sistotremastrum suecicum HHB10207 ss-3]